jgi:hypothetical protein
MSLISKYLIECDFQHVPTTVCRFLLLALTAYFRPKLITLPILRIVRFRGARLLLLVVVVNMFRTFLQQASCTSALFSAALSEAAHAINHIQIDTLSLLNLSDVGQTDLASHQDLSYCVVC